MSLAIVDLPEPDWPTRAIVLPDSFAEEYWNPRYNSNYQLIVPLTRENSPWGSHRVEIDYIELVFGTNSVYLGVD